ncbi:MAG: hypothetical protein AB7R89_06150 [Dehalococcoidia bacterium]
MADRVVRLVGDPPTPFRAVDNGDGTYALAVSAADAIDIAAIAAGENHIGQVTGVGNVALVALSTDANPYDAGDVIAATQSFTGLRKNDSRAVIKSLTVIDASDQGVALTVVFLSVNVSIGTENEQPSLAAANASAVLGCVDVAEADYRDLGDVKVATITNINLLCEGLSFSNLYVAVVNGSGTPTYSANSLLLNIGVVFLD